MSTQKIDSISVILPSYNEEKNIKIIIPYIATFIPQIADKFEIILVDDGSTDGTYKTVNILKKEYDFIKYIRHSENSGYGAALISGFEAAKFQLIFFMDTDGQFDISEIKKMFCSIQDYDIIIGDRIKREDKWHRVILGKIYANSMNYLFRLNYSDINCGFKLIKKKVLDRLNLQSKTSFVNIEMLTKAKENNFAIKEIEIRHFPRLKGEPKGFRIKTIISKLAEALKFYMR